MIALVLMVILVVTGIVKYFLHMWRMERYVKHLKITTPVYPFIGNASQLVGKTATQAFCEIMEFIKVHDTPLKLYLGPILAVISDRPEDFKAVFKSQFDKPYVYTFLNGANSENNILTATCKFVIQVNTF